MCEMCDQEEEVTEKQRLLKSYIAEKWQSRDRTPTHLGEDGNAKEDWCRIPSRQEYGREVTERRQDGNLERKEFCDVAVSSDEGVDGSRHRAQTNGPTKEDSHNGIDSLSRWLWVCCVYFPQSIQRTWASWVGGSHRKGKKCMDPKAREADLRIQMLEEIVKIREQDMMSDEEHVESHDDLPREVC